MLKKIVATLAFLCASVAFAAVDVNKASEAELDAVKGIGPAMSKRILDERKKGDFKSWDDLIIRVKGVGENKAAKLSDEGLRVGESAFKTVGTDAKAKDEKKVAAAKPAASAAKK